MKHILLLTLALCGLVLGDSVIKPLPTQNSGTNGKYLRSNGTSPETWETVTAGTTYTAGTGITLPGNAITFNPSTVTDASIPVAKITGLGTAATADMDNATINSAIATNPAASRTAANVVGKPDSLFNVMDYGATHDGVLLRTGAITSGQATLVCSGAAFVAGDVGKRIVVKRAGANQVDSAGNTNKLDLVTTIASINSATSVQLSATAGNTTTAADVVYGTDQSSYIQLALNAVVAAGGGTVYLPAGIYFVDGAAQDVARSNSILKVPATLDEMTVEIVGDLPPTPQFSLVTAAHGTINVNYEGTTLIRTAAHSGRIIGGSEESLNGYLYFSNARLVVKNMRIRGVGGFDWIGVGGRDFASLGCEEVLVDAGLITPAHMPEPGANSAGIECPAASCIAADLRNCYVQTVENGFIFNEHVNADNLTAQFCKAALLQKDGFYLSRISNLSAQWNKNIVKSSTGASYLYITTLSFEDYNSGGVDGSRWYNPSTHISDSSSYIQGELASFYGVLAFGATTVRLTVSGANKFKTHYLNAPGYVINDRNFARANTTTSPGSLFATYDVNAIDTLDNGAYLYLISPAANASYCQWTNVFLPAGNPKLTIIGATATNRGIIDISVNGVVIGSFDQYENPGGYNVVHDIVWVNKVAGFHTVRATVNGKNASSSGYNFCWSKIYVREN